MSSVRSFHLANFNLRKIIGITYCNVGYVIFLSSVMGEDGLPFGSDARHLF